MIKINLLPFRAARKKENIRRQVSVYILTVVLMLAAGGYLFLTLSSTIGDLRSEKAEKKQVLATYSGTIKKIANINKKIEEIEAKLAVIRELEENKTGPVRLLEQIASAIPKEKLWLNSLQQDQGVLTLNGTAMDNDTVALFMTNLEQQDRIQTVDLESTRLKPLSQYSLNVTDFSLKCRIHSPAAEPGGQKPKRG